MGSQSVATPDTDNHRRLPVKNRGSYTIPARGVMKIVKIVRDTTSGEAYWLVDRPDADSDLNVLFNTESSIPPGGYGFGVCETPAWALYEPKVFDGTHLIYSVPPWTGRNDNGVAIGGPYFGLSSGGQEPQESFPIPGENWGTRAGSFSLSLGSFGFSGIQFDPATGSFDNTAPFLRKDYAYTYSPVLYYPQEVNAGAAVNFQWGTNPGAPPAGFSSLAAAGYQSPGVGGGDMHAVWDAGTGTPQEMLWVVRPGLYLVEVACQFSVTFGHPIAGDKEVIYAVGFVPAQSGADFRPLNASAVTVTRQYFGGPVRTAGGAPQTYTPNELVSLVSSLFVTTDCNTYPVSSPSTRMGFSLYAQITDNGPGAGTVHGVIQPTGFKLTRVAPTPDFNLYLP